MESDDGSSHGLSLSWQMNIIIYGTMDKEFEIIEHTADVGIRAYGANMQEAFANAAKGLFSLIIELDDVEEVMHRDTELP